MTCVTAVAFPKRWAADELARIERLAKRHDVRYLGRAMCWRRFGNGAPLVLIHGGHGSWMHWVRNIEALSARHAVWVPDLPGFGDSQDPVGTVHAADAKQQLIDALIATLNTLVGRGTPVAAAGFSFGGLMAAELAVQRGCVTRLALLGSAGHGGTRRQQTELVNWRSSDRAERRAALRHNLAAFMLHDAAQIDDLAVAVYEACCQGTRFRSKPISRGSVLQTALGQFTKPLLLIWGEHDVTATPDQIAPQLAEGGPGRDWCVVPGAGHWVQYERAADVNQLLGTWFQAEHGEEP